MNIQTAIYAKEAFSPPVGKAADIAEPDRDPCDLRLPRDQLMAFVERDTLPIPVSADREGYGGDDHWNYWNFGLLDYTRIKKSCDERDIKLDGARVVELGGATGRVMRHIVANHSNVDAYIAEINNKHVDWVKQYAAPKIKAFHNTISPHLPFEDNSVDVVMAFSVFTHIDYHADALILEIRRILRPGGLAYLSIHTEDTWANRQGLLVDLMMAYPGYSEISEANPASMPAPLLTFRKDELNPYLCMVYQTHDWTRQNWGIYFSRCDVVDRLHGSHGVALMVK